MADTTATPTLVDRWQDTKRIHVVGTIAIGASPLTYPTGGIPIDLLTGFAAGNPGEVALPGVSNYPFYVSIKGLAGYSYLYDKTNKKIIIQAAGGAAAHTHDLLFIGGIAITEPVAIAAGDTLGKNAATNRTVAGSASATKGGVVASAAAVAAAQIELANALAIPAGISGDTIDFYAIYKLA